MNIRISQYHSSNLYLGSPFLNQYHFRVQCSSQKGNENQFEIEGEPNLGLVAEIYSYKSVVSSGMWNGRRV